jgi:TPP-dependent pyruvate/acetoin dehydrogenase alpha subunit
VAKKHIDRVRQGGGPSLIAANTYRLKAHYEGDAQRYRPIGEIEEWQQTKDPLPRYQNQLMKMGLLTQADVDRMEKEVDVEIEAAIQTVKNLPSRSGSGPNVGLAVDGI